MSIYLNVSSCVHEEDLKENIIESLSDEKLKLFIMGLDLSRGDLEFSLSLVDDLLCSIKESTDEDEEHFVDDARSCLDQLGWR